MTRRETKRCACSKAERIAVCGTRSDQRAFTLIELLVVIAIIGVLAAITIIELSDVRVSAREARAQHEFRSIHTALQLYANEHGGFPPDTDRDIPPGLERYLGQGIWPTAAWENSVLDWDNWQDPATGEQIMQISIRFCTSASNINSCRFPDADWTTGFDTHSALYYCIEGPCRSHIDRPISHPGRCVNC